MTISQPAEVTGRIGELPPCVLCVGEPDGCPRCGGSGIDPDPLAPVLDGAR